MTPTTRTRAALLAAAALLAGLAVPAALPAVAAPRGSTGTTAPTGTPVQVWLTTQDKRALLAPQPALALQDGPVPTGTVVDVDPAERHQVVRGFGASITGSSAALLAALPAKQRDAAMASLFSPSRGIGLSYLRQPVGASDFSTSHYSYDDVPAGERDDDLSAFSVAKDSTALGLVKQAAAASPGLTVTAAPWSAPAWMKTSGSLVGGTLRDDAHDAYARYLVKTVQAYRAAGVPVTDLSVANEATYSPADYPGMLLSPAQTAALVGRALGPALRTAGLSTGVLAGDDNWDTAGDALQVAADPLARPHLTGFGAHCYRGDSGQQAPVRAAGLDVHVTECSGGSWGAGFGGDLWWDVHTLLIGAVRNGASTVAKWNLALDPQGGPHLGGCGDCRGVVTVDPATGKVTHNAEYYALGHLAKFVRPGSVRIGSTSGQDGVETVAFRTPAGGTVLVVLNSGPTQTVVVRAGGRTAPLSLVSGAVATLTW